MLRSFNRKKRAVSILLCVVIAASAVAWAIPIHRANAVLPATIVFDPIATPAAAKTSVETTLSTASTIAGWLDTAWRFVQDTLLKTLLATLKKRILDEITNETVQWIQNGQTPLFTQNFGDVLTNAANAAAGDVLQQMGAGQLCTGLPQQLINIQLAQPQTLSQSVSCTLSQAVGNIEAFKQNFSNGSWIGYHNLLMPQNNQYGIEILTEQALENTVQQKTQAATLEQQVNLGFTSQECVDNSGNPDKGWVLYDTKTGQPVPNTLPQGYDPLTHQPPTSSVPGTEYRCQKWKITTPGRTIADSVSQALGSNVNFIINSQDISSVLGAVLDAAFNRLVSEGIKGIKTGLAGLSSSGTAQTIRDNEYAAGITDAAQAYAAQASSTLANQSGALLAPLNNASSSINNALGILTSASSSVAYLYQTAYALNGCLGSNASTTDLAWASSTITLATSTYPGEISQQMGDVTQEASVISGLFVEAQNIQQDPTQMTQSFKDSITTAFSTATGLESAANKLANTIGYVLNETQNRLSICVNTTNTSISP